MGYNIRHHQESNSNLFRPKCAPIPKMIEHSTRSCRAEILYLCYRVPIFLESQGIRNFPDKSRNLKNWSSGVFRILKMGGKFSLATSAHTKEGAQVFLFFQCKKIFWPKGGYGPLNTPLNWWNFT